MLLGTSESIPVNNGDMKIGTYQNIIVVNFINFLDIYIYTESNKQVDADGPKNRTIAVQVMGTK
jgi:hypothetical protein